jgi:hypothetical protein
VKVCTEVLIHVLVGNHIFKRHSAQLARNSITYSGLILLTFNILASKEIQIQQKGTGRTLQLLLVTGNRGELVRGDFCDLGVGEEWNYLFL